MEKPPSIQDLTDQMNSVRIQRPFTVIESNGPPTNPIPFGKPKVARGRRDTVLVWHNDTHQQCKNVLFRDDNNKLTTAYWSIPHKEPIKTIMGHVQICLVLSRCTSECSSDSESENDDSDDDEEDIVFSFTNQYVAIKVNYCSRVESMRNKHAEDPMKEIAAMQWIGNAHPNVLGIKDVLFDGSNINVVLPYCRDGDVFELLQEAQKRLPIPGIPEERARFYIRQVLLGLQHLSRKGICHRDLSPENIMMDRDGCIVIDMGMCLQIPHLDAQGKLCTVDSDDGAGGNNKRLLISPQGACGKLPYMAPEIYANAAPFDGEAVDIWSCGTILFCMLTGNRSYGRSHPSDPQFYWMTNGLELLLKDWSVPLSPPAVALLKGMLTVDPRERLTLKEVLTHEWFQQR